MDKADIRKLIIEKRKNNYERLKKAETKIIEALSKDLEFLNSTYIGIYYPMYIEINLLNLINLYPDKVFGFPKIIGHDMIFVSYDKTKGFNIGPYQIHEPISDLDVSDKIEYYLVPSLASYKNYRLGFGKGYYDRYFNKYNQGIKVGVHLEDEIIEFTPSNLDIPLDKFLMG